MDEEEIYRAVLSRLSAKELEQHYAPLFDKRLEDARVKLVEALAAVRQLQGVHESMAKLGHPESHVAMEKSAELLPLASKAIDIQQQLLAAIELRMVATEVWIRHSLFCVWGVVPLTLKRIRLERQPQVSRKHSRSRSPPIKIERSLHESTDQVHTDGNSELSLRDTESRLVPPHGHQDDIHSEPSPLSRISSNSDCTHWSVNNNASSTWADTNSSNTTGRVVVMHDPNEATNGHEVFHEYVQNCTRLVDHAAPLRTVLYRRDHLDELVPEVLNALYFLSDNARADFWRDRSVRSDLWDLQGYVNSTISLVQDVGAFDQLVKYLTLLFIEVCYVVGNFDHFREYFVGCRQRISDLRQRRKRQTRSMESTEKEWKGMAVRALRNARRVSGEQDAAARERRVEATCLDLITIFTRIDDEPRFADRFLGEDEFIYLRKAVEIAVESMTETRVRGVANARLSTRFLDTMKLATQRFERLRVQVHR